MTAGRGPAIARRRLGAQLRTLRDRSGLLLDAVAEHLECSPAKVSRLENGKGLPRLRDVRDLLDLYGIQDEQLKRELLDLAAQGQQHGWWYEEYSELIDDKTRNFIALEDGASALHAYEVNLVFGLLQTEAYARAVLKVLAGPLADRENLDQWIGFRLKRQEILRRPDDPVRLHVVLEEAVVRRPVGGRRVQKEQLSSLLESSTQPNITIQLLPVAVGMHQAVAGSFTLLQFARPDDHELVYIESADGGTVHHENTSDAPRYRRIFDAIRHAALTPGGTRDRIREVISEL
ncbi:MAG TPA: helix-turn-helix transcriptional regulator [Pseudonocardiaceae bacterium]